MTVKRPRPSERTGEREREVVKEAYTLWHFGHLSIVSVVGHGIAFSANTFFTSTKLHKANISPEICAL